MWDEEHGNQDGEDDGGEQRTNHLVKSAMSKANWNEQYSRTSNVKLQGVTEEKNKNTKETFKKW
jgi:hypothetical protein